MTRRRFAPQNDRGLLEDDSGPARLVDADGPWGRDLARLLLDADLERIAGLDSR